MFCNNCGAQVNDGVQFCPNCGKTLNNQVNQQPIYQPVNQQPVNQQPVNQQPVYQPVNQPTVQADPSIFTMGLLSLIFADTFFLSFLGIIFGAIAKNKVKAFEALGGVLTGKSKVGSILAKIGLILGIVLTVIFVIYIFIIVIGVISTASSSIYY